jgi:uncharacterized membrane protein YjgN (DUF898 family)
MASAEGSAAAPIRHDFEFRGTGREFFRIWILNLALTLLTFGIYSAWAKVRTQRYLYGNTYIAGHALDYDPSPWRILIGRTIALAAFLSYSITVGIWPQSLGLWYLAFGALLPWLINSSLRFNARNTSYRNIRFNFTGDYVGALVNYVVWPILGYGTLGLLLPRARKARDYFYVNKHAYGGRDFETNFSTGRIYLIYIAGIAIFFALIAGLFAGFYALAQETKAIKGLNLAAFGPYVAFIIAPLYIIVYTIASTFIDIMVFNLSLNRAKFDGRHELRSRVSPWVMSWIVVSNLVLILLTVGLFYPWARIRMTRYETTRLSLLAASDLDEYTSELSRARSAIGEEVAGFFDLGIGL